METKKEKVVYLMVGGQEFIAEYVENGHEKLTVRNMYKKVMMQTPQGPQTMLLADDLLTGNIRINNNLIAIIKELDDEKAKPLVDHYWSGVKEKETGVYNAPKASLIK